MREGGGGVSARSAREEFVDDEGAGLRGQRGEQQLEDEQARFQGHRQVSELRNDRRVCGGRRHNGHHRPHASGLRVAPSQLEQFDLAE